METTLTKPVAIAEKPAILGAGGRVPGIDVLRGFCIIAVVLHHINLRIHFRDSDLGHWIGPAANRALFWSGYYGVRVFFVISGFLITTWSLKRWGALAQLNRRQFYRMRFARIVPCLVGLLLVLAILDRLSIHYFTINTQHTSLGRALLAALTFHINWLEARTGYLPANWDVLWSLSVEEVFYVFFPLLCTLVRKQWLLITLLCCLLVIGPYARIHTQNELWSDYGYLSCMDGIAFGCLAAMLSAKIKLGDRSILTLGIIGSLLLVFIDILRGPASSLGLYKVGLDVTTLQLGAALLVVALQQRFERRALRHDSVQSNVNSPSRFASARKALRNSTAFLRWFGRNSYEVYLTHMLVVWPMVILFWHFKQSINTAVWWFFATTALSGVLGWIVARFYSEPLNHRLRMQSPSSTVKTFRASAD
jgi:peptidoglycan/LPS O-acetylase OafA/YrhL